MLLSVVQATELGLMVDEVEIAGIYARCTDHLRDFAVIAFKEKTLCTNAL